MYTGDFSYEFFDILKKIAFFIMSAFAPMNQNTMSK
jgi:hypothetical protein